MSEVRPYVSRIEPHNSTVNGHSYARRSQAWKGLLLDHPFCQFRSASVWGRDKHLQVPWKHPDDTQWECYYRVRPIADGVADAVLIDGDWYWRIFVPDTPTDEEVKP